MKIVLQKTRTFVPKFNKNRELPEKEQIVVEYQKPNARQRRTLRRNLYQSEAEGQSVKFEVYTDIDGTVREIPCKIKHFSVEENGKAVEVTSLAQLVEIEGEAAGLFNEILTEIWKDDLTAEDLKNSASASA
jgi:hypothetical protein